MCAPQQTRTFRASIVCSLHRESIVINRKSSSAGLVAAIALCTATAAWAQEKQRLSFVAPAANAKYVQQHSIHVGDAPGHDLRVFELVRTFGDDGPLIAGVRLKQIRSVGYSDYTELNGPGYSYHQYTLENGDKFFARTAIVSHNTGKGATNLTSGPISGGTGKFAGIRGTARNASQFDPASGSNQSRLDLEYWIDAAQR
jgi:hypothetical protein